MIIMMEIISVNLDFEKDRKRRPWVHPSPLFGQCLEENLFKDIFLSSCSALDLTLRVVSSFSLYSHEWHWRFPIHRVNVQGREHSRPMIAKLEKEEQGK